MIYITIASGNLRERERERESERVRERESQRETEVSLKGISPEKRGGFLRDFLNV